MTIRLKPIIRNLGLLTLLAVTWGIDVYHMTVFIPPRLDPSERTLEDSRAKWLPRGEIPIHQLVLEGKPYERGVAAGRATRELLKAQEQSLIGQLNQIFPSPLIIRVGEVFLRRWFWGMDRYIEPWMAKEMYGISQSASPDFDPYGDRYSRQVSYHALHEVGQMMVDQGQMACTVVALPHAGSWIVGRTFDFEGGRVFDTEKIMKWVFPDEGHAFVSVIWAGMVGAVTGVNDAGVYISLNAAGSSDFRRFGTPSTLVLLKALQFSKSAEEAVEMIRKEQMFITDIFAVADSSSKRFYRIEKSPDHTEVLATEEPTAIGNHLDSEHWREDSINQYRATELTSHYRESRGRALIQQLAQSQSKPKAKSARDLELGVLKILRDKGEKDGKPLHLGNRRAIDALIATHAVVYNAKAKILYVSHGPGVSGAFSGFDLKRSFEKHEPVSVADLPRDEGVSDEDFLNARLAIKEAAAAEHFVRKSECDSARSALERSRSKLAETYQYYSTQGDYLSRCKKDDPAAREAWKKALALGPAYARETRALDRKLQGKGEK